ncbi:MAG: orotidine 5'-phosphate decarboxylase, partial [Gemmatimonadetes bacterium]|nr:orotidine 5'-phosphate decarboxylase [Gemmatimonadota bacterium]
WLEQLAAHIGDRAITIGDAKRGDIGNSARNYAQAVFGHLNLDAVTVNPYMGSDALELWRALGDGAVGVDRLAHLVRLTPAQVLAGLAELEIVGWAIRDSGMRFRRSA